VFCSVGWTYDKENRVEVQVSNTWTQKRSAFAKDQEYVTSLGRNTLGATTFLATAVSRDDGIVFTKQRLNEIRDRMELTEQTTVSYKGETYRWDDLCFKITLKSSAARLRLGCSCRSHGSPNANSSGND
jgi:hypothetical protein